MTTKRLEISIIALIVVLYLITAWAYANRTPDWQVPDEPAHYNYSRQIVENGGLPVIEHGDWNQEYLVLLTSSGFAPETLDRIETVQYEDHQPPLYYLLQAGVYSITGRRFISNAPIFCHYRWGSHYPCVGNVASFIPTTTVARIKCGCIYCLFTPAHCDYGRS